MSMNTGGGEIDREELRNFRERDIKHLIRNSSLLELLRVAQCPDMDCKDGVVTFGPGPDGHWESNPCQWCCERETALKGE